MEYIVRVWLNAEEEHTIKYKGSPYVLAQSATGPVWMDIATPTEEVYGSDSWEHNMIDSVLDGFKGTDMSIIKDIEY